MKKMINMHQTCKVKVVTLVCSVLLLVILIAIIAMSRPMTPEPQGTSPMSPQPSPSESGVTTSPSAPVTVQPTEATTITKPLETVPDMVPAPSEGAPTEPEIAETEPLQTAPQQTVPEETEPEPVSRPSTKPADTEPDEDDPIWKLNHPTLTEVHEYRYAHWESITVYDRMAICTDSIGNKIFCWSYGNIIGELGFNEEVICTGVYDNGWFRIEYAGQTGYVKPDGVIYKLYSEPVIFTYPDGTTGTELRDGATYLDDDGIKQTYFTKKDDAGREAGTICETCGKTVASWNSEGIYCVQYDSRDFCTKCGTFVDAYTCHTCENYDASLFYCGHCYKLRGDGSNGTCTRWDLGSGGDKTCPSCGTTVPMYTCHTCGIPIDMTLPGTKVDSIDQLTDEHKADLVKRADGIIHSVWGDNGEKLVAVYAFILTDKTALSSKSRCCCFFIFTSIKPYSETPVYHCGEFYDIYIRDDGAICCQALGSESRTYSGGEAQVVEDYMEIGTEITKIWQAP